VLQLRPSVVLVDIGLPDIDGIEVTKQIKSADAQVRVLMLTASDDERDIFDALDAGADGYVLKDSYSKNLEIAIRSVRLGAVWLDPAIARSVLRASQRPSSRRHETNVQALTLSAEERTVLGQVAESNCQDGVCLVDPEFLHNLRRFSHNAPTKQSENEAPRADARQ
ncbi:MAG: response regulator, partial [Terriglobales bacterium]